MPDEDKSLNLGSIMKPFMDGVRQGLPQTPPNNPACRFKEGGPDDDPDLCRSCYGSKADHMNTTERRTEIADMVNHPPHYTAYKGLEVIDLTEQLNFNRGNAVKYICRAGLKNDDPTEDLKKAAWYINREIQRLQSISDN